jgi:hypothetical protein
VPQGLDGNLDEKTHHRIVVCHKNPHVRPPS